MIGGMYPHDVLADGTDTHGFTPLIVAAFNGHTESAHMLLRYKANPNVLATDGCDALLCAVQGGHIDTIKQLIKHKANVGHSADDKQIVTPIYSAAQEGNAGVIKILAKAKADVNRRTEGVPPIFISAQEGHSSCVRALIKAGADCNLKNLNHASPLFIAAQKGHVPVCRELLKCKQLNIDESTDTGATPLHIAIQTGNVEVTKMLIEAGAKTENADKNGTTALIIAATYGDLDIAEVLIETGAELNKKDKLGRSAEMILKQDYGEDLNKIVVRHQRHNSDHHGTEGEKARDVTFSDIFYNQAKNIFGHFDANGNNVLEAAELRKCLVGLGMDKKLGAEKFEVFVSRKCKTRMDFPAFLELYRQGMGYVTQAKREHAKSKMRKFESDLAIVEIHSESSPKHRKRKHHASSNKTVPDESMVLPGVAAKIAVGPSLKPMRVARQHDKAKPEKPDGSIQDTGTRSTPTPLNPLATRNKNLKRVRSTHKMSLKRLPSLSGLKRYPRLKLPPLENPPENPLSTDLKIKW